MSKKRILSLSIHYPMAMSLYIERALRRRDDVELVTIGPFTGNQIPWKSGISVPMKYINPPDVLLPFPPNIGKIPWPLAEFAVMQSNISLEFDMVLCIDAGIQWTERPDVKCPVVHIGTDPHVLNDSYDVPRTYSDYFFSMQSGYMKKGDYFFPYGFDPTIHYPEPATEKIYDAALVGLQYPNRVRLVNELRQRNYKIFFDTGPIMDDYRHINNQAAIGLNWSSLNDVTARVFEIMGMGLVPIINRIPDLDLHFKEGEHYLGFNTTEEAIEVFENQMMFPLGGLEIADKARVHAWKNHTWDIRVRDLLNTVFGNEIIKDLGFDTV